MLFLVSATQTLEADLQTANAKYEACEAQLMKSEERGNALSESIHHIRQSLESEISGLTAKCAATEQQLQLSRDTVASLTAKIDVRPMPRVCACVRMPFLCA